MCGCDDGWFPDRCGVCQLIFSHEGCPSGLAHQFNTEFEFRCLPTPCPRNRPLQLPGGRGCSFFGAVSNSSARRLGQIRWRRHTRCWISHANEGVGIN